MSFFESATDRVVTTECQQLGELGLVLQWPLFWCDGFMTDSGLTPDAPASP